jgi:glycosyltransferase involved in cell wall biosynthesis
LNGSESLAFESDQSARVAFVIPAYQAEATIGPLVRELLARARDSGRLGEPSVIVVNDGSRDATAARARDSGALVLEQPENRGKGCALLLGLSHALRSGARAAVSLDADGQHPPEEALRLALDPSPKGALVLAVRDLSRAGAPVQNRFSNGFSNLWMSWFAGRPLRDTQCGLRRYPLPETLELGLRGARFELESEVILRAVRAGIPVIEIPARVLYPEHRTSHFRKLVDPARIVVRLLHTAATAPVRRSGP